MKLLLLRQREEANPLQRHEVKGGKDEVLIRTHPFFLKRDFSKRLLNDEFQKFWEKKKNVKIPLSAIWLVQRDFYVYYIKSEILLLVLHSLHDNLEVITTLQDDILQEV